MKYQFKKPQVRLLVVDDSVFVRTARTILTTIFTTTCWRKSKLHPNRGTCENRLPCLSGNPARQLHTPSTSWCSRTMGIIMTGMGTEGAQGINAIQRSGGLTLGQDEPTSAVYGMTRACTQMGTLDRIAPLLQIPQEILQATRYVCRGLVRPCRQSHLSAGPKSLSPAAIASRSKTASPCTLVDKQAIPLRSVAAHNRS